MINAVSFFLSLFSFLCALTELPSVEEGSVGETSVQVDLFTHPGTGEHKVTVKGKHCSFLLFCCSLLCHSIRMTTLGFEL